jgi:hypothetical protein
VNSVEDLRQRLRQQSEFEAQTGWCQFYHAWRAELPRLCPGLSCRSLIDAVSSEINIQAAKAKKSGKQSSEWSPDLDKPALALECCTDKRTVDRDIKYLESSGMAQVRHSIRGTVSIRLMYRDWQNLPDYAPPDRPEPSPADQPETPKETFNLVKSPQPVKAGQFSERVKVACAVSSFRFQAAGAVDLAFTAVVKGGEFLVTSREVVSKRNPQGEEQAKAPSGISKLDVQSRHECLDGPKFSTGKGEEKAKGRTTGEHPRAAELAKLFDDWLLRSCHKSLSADTAALGEALDALADTPHDFLVKMVVDRARRPVSSPKVCVSICKEVRANYLKLLAAHDFVDVPGFNRMSRAEAVAQLESQIESEDDPECLQWAKRELTKLVDSGKIPPQSEQAEESKQRRKVR